MCRKVNEQSAMLRACSAGVGDVLSSVVNSIDKDCLLISVAMFGIHIRRAINFHLFSLMLANIVASRTVRGTLSAPVVPEGRKYITKPLTVAT